MRPPDSFTLEIDIDGRLRELERQEQQGDPEAKERLFNELERLVHCGIDWALAPYLKRRLERGDPYHFGDCYTVHPEKYKTCERLKEQIAGDNPWILLHGEACFEEFNALVCEIHERRSPSKMLVRLSASYYRQGSLKILNRDWRHAREGTFAIHNWEDIEHNAELQKTLVSLMLNGRARPKSLIVVSSQSPKLIRQNPKAHSFLKTCFADGFHCVPVSQSLEDLHAVILGILQTPKFQRLELVRSHGLKLLDPETIKLCADYSWPRSYAELVLQLDIFLTCYKGALNERIQEGMAYFLRGLSEA
ncbi:MAG: hypothetical protein P1V97_30390 [Planctomycetota bacterium]|nr:hypothetical protein [Planctomycetota bacterium]